MIDTQILANYINSSIGNIPYRINQVCMVSQNAFNVNLTTFEYGYPIQKILLFNILPKKTIDLRRNRTEQTTQFFSSSQTIPEITELSIQNWLLNISGNNFTQGSQLVLNGIFFDTNYISDKELSVQFDPIFVGGFMTAVKSGDKFSTAENYGIFNQDKNAPQINDGLEIYIDIKNPIITLNGQKLNTVTDIQLSYFDPNNTNITILNSSKIINKSDQNLTVDTGSFTNGQKITGPFSLTLFSNLPGSQNKLMNDKNNQPFNTIVGISITTASFYFVDNSK
jgi:hypothetical protein